ncbi:alpha-amlyase [Lentibacillus lipolyticus]|nr:alpha-amlyase [Lentibacillus lipolyticus]
MKRFVILLAALLVISVATPAAAQEKEEEVEGQIFYNILVDRFNNGDQSLDTNIDLDDPSAFHGGDLQGIITKLDHLQEMGYTTLILSPIMDNAPNGYHGYWVEDFRKVDPQYGTMKDLKKLVDEAHSRDMKIVLEFVTNYVANTHPMLDDPDKAGWVQENNEDASHRWLDKTIALDQTNPEVQAFLKETADFWMEEANIDGYRFHASDKTNQAFLRDLTAHIHEKDASFFQLGDILDPGNYNGELADLEWIDAVENNTWHETMADTLAKPGAPVETIYNVWRANGKRMGLNYLDSKYTERFTYKLVQNGRNPLTTWKLALTYLYTAPGAPMILQGSEIPMAGKDFPDIQRMVRWNSADEDLQTFAGRIAALRSEYPALKHGDYELAGSDGAMSVFKRSYEGETVFIAVNNDTHSRSVAVEDVPDGKQLKGLLGDNLVRAGEDGEFRIGLARETSEVYVIQNNTGLNWTLIVPLAGIFFIFIVGVIYLSRKQKKAGS